MIKKGARQDSSVVNNQYYDFLKDKRVIIVGPAWHSKNSKQKDFIEKYDVVVRMNAGSIIPTEKVVVDIGSRIDIWYCSLSGYFFNKEIITSKFLKELKQRGLKWISCPYVSKRAGGIRKLEKYNKCSIPIHVVNHEYYKDLYSISKTKITTGLVTIYDLLHFDIKELYLTGMSFYSTDVINKRKTYYSGYIKGVTYVNQKSVKHNFFNELKIFANIYKKYKKINCDDTLKQILKNMKKYEK